MDSVFDAVVADSPALLQRYCLTLHVPRVPYGGDNYRIKMALTRTQPLPAEAYRDLLAPLDHNTPYLASAVDETFDASEVGLLRVYFAEHEPDCALEATPCGPIGPNDAGIGVLPVSGYGQGFYEFSPAPPLPIEGYYDLESPAWSRRL